MYKRQPYKLGEEMELILTTAGHIPALRAAVPEKEKLLPVALTLGEASLPGLAALWDYLAEMCIRDRARMKPCLTSSCLQRASSASGINFSQRSSAVWAISRMARDLLTFS